MSLDLADLLKRLQAAEELARDVEGMNVADEFKFKEPDDLVNPAIEFAMTTSEKIMAESNKLWRAQRDAALEAYQEKIRR